MATQSDFSIPVNGYVAFDAVSLKNLIIQRLNDSAVFTDQNYTGSNISAIIDIVAYAYHVLMFYQNQNASESQFTQASLYENINKIVKALNYNPIGFQSATLSFEAGALATLAAGSYTIPRYSYFSLNGINYVFSKDATFTKKTSAEEPLTELSDNNLLVQGSVVEYPTYTATGEPYELFTLIAADDQGNNVPIDHFSINVYVKDNTKINSKYEQYTATDSLFLEQPDSKKYEIRLNEKGRYEIKFGNGIFGKQLSAGDEVSVYYIQSDQQQGQVDVGAINGSKLLFFTSAKFDQIKSDVISSYLNIITISQASNIVFSNSNPSTEFQDIESVDSIRTNALNTFKTQFRLITPTDYETFVQKYFGSIVSSVRCVNNDDYINSHQKYFFDLGIEKPNTESRILLNQVKFSSSCNFGNVYIYAVPKLNKITTLNTRINYLNTAQKQLVVDEIKPYKASGGTVVINDPVYTAVDFGVKFVGEQPLPTIGLESYLEITTNTAESRNFDFIKQSAAKIITDVFKITNDNLGLLIDMQDISSKIQSIPGVKTFKTIRKSASQTAEFPGLSFVIYNPVYPNADIEVFQQNVQLPFFKFPYFNDAQTILNRIVVV